MPAQRLGRGQRRHLAAEGLAHRLQLDDVARRGRSAVGVEVIDLAHRRAVQPRQRHAHAAHRALARRRHHVGAIRGHAIADQLGQDRRTAGDRVFVLLQHQHAAAAGDDEAIAVRVIRARGGGRGVVALGRQRAHGVELRGHRPVQLLAAAGDHDVLGAVADQVRAGADAVRRGRAGRRQRIAHAADAERRRQRRRHRGAHRARHHVRADLAHAPVAQQVGGFHLPLRRTAAGTGHQPGALAAHLRVIQARRRDGIARGDVGVRRGVAHEALELAIDGRGQVDLRHARNLAAQAQLLVFGHEADPGPAVTQRAGHRLQVVAKARHHTHPGNHDATHCQNPLVEENRPTRRSEAR